jgi:hypothetical protein
MAALEAGRDFGSGALNALHHPRAWGNAPSPRRRRNVIPEPRATPGKLSRAH